MPHSAVNSFTFKDGTHVPKGNWVCIPQQAIMGDPSLYNDPTVFQGFRFVNREDEENPTSKVRFSHPSWIFPYWGTIKQAWLVFLVAPLISLQTLFRGED